MKMASENSLEGQLKTLERSMGTLVKAFKELKSNVKALEDKVDKSINGEVIEIKRNQKMLEDLIKGNSDAIKLIDDAILELRNENSKAKEEEIKKTETFVKKCKYFNSGYCKFKTDCKFLHPKEICTIYLEGGECDRKLCKNRHPKVCKWLQGKSGCQRNDCDYLHVTLARDDEQRNKTHKSFPCAGCKNCYDDISCVVQYRMNNIAFNLCLNCESWIQHKDKVLTPGWTMFDQNGDLRSDV